MNDDCPDCGGDGYTYHDYADHNGEHKEHKIRCRCNPRKDEEEEYDDQE